MIESLGPWAPRILGALVVIWLLRGAWWAWEGERAVRRLLEPMRSWRRRQAALARARSCR